MSSDGQAVGPGVPLSEGVAYDLTSEAGFDWHVHTEHQLTWAAQGVLLVGAGNGTWVLPRSRALWIPGGTRHSVLAAGRATMHTVYVEPGPCPITWTRPTIVDAGGFLGQLIA